MKKHLISLYLLVALCPLGYSQNESGYIELAKVIQTNGAKSQAKMSIAPKANDSDKLRNEFFDYESIKIDAVIEPASDDAGRDRQRGARNRQERPLHERDPDSNREPKQQ